MSTKRKPANPLGLTPAEFAAAEYNRIRLAQSIGGRNRWKGSTKKQRSEAMRKVALAKANTVVTHAETGSRTHGEIRPR